MLKRIIFSLLICAFLILWGWSFKSSLSLFSETKEEKKPVNTEAAAPVPAPKPRSELKPKYVRGVHLSAWVAGSKKLRSRINKLLETTELNSIVIALKEYEGEVYIDGYKGQQEFGTYKKAIPDLEEYLKYLNDKGVYTIARIVVFKDNNIVKKKPEWAVKTKDGKVWKDHAGYSWADPYSKEVWDYNIGIAERAVEAGFDEIQFDYTRFPSDGNMKNCFYSQKNSSSPATQAEGITAFLHEAYARLKPRGVNVSVDIFGLTTTSTDDMGIGQRIVEMAREVDFVSPMVYPSHYAEGEYGIPDPDADPYKTVYTSLNTAAKRIGPEKLRPYLQDFSIQHHYGANEVRKQIQAAYDNGIGDWVLWDPKCVYTAPALKSKQFTDMLEKSPNILAAEKSKVNVSTAPALTSN